MSSVPRILPIYKYTYTCPCPELPRAWLRVGIFIRNYVGLQHIWIKGMSPTSQIHKAPSKRTQSILCVSWIYLFSPCKQKKKNLLILSTLLPHTHTHTHTHTNMFHVRFRKKRLYFKSFFWLLLLLIRGNSWRNLEFFWTCCVRIEIHMLTWISWWFWLGPCVESLDATVILQFSMQLYLNFCTSCELNSISFEQICVCVPWECVKERRRLQTISRLKLFFPAHWWLTW